MKFGIDYDTIFKDRLIIITGVGRSGTTILGKILGSMKNTYYLFEPAMLKCQVYKDYLDLPILFEDYFLPLIQGRNLNFNSGDSSYYKYYYSPAEVKNAWNTLSRRTEAIEYVKQKRPFFIIKCPEFQPLAQKLSNIIPSVMFINITRNCNDVINSTVNREWYIDGYTGVDYFDENNIPYFVDDESKEYWNEWNEYTRAACVWRCLIEIELPGNTRNIEYEKLVKEPLKTINMLGLELERTIVTDRNINSVKEKVIQYPYKMDCIEPPEDKKGLLFE